MPYSLQACCPPVTICRQRVANLNRLSDPPECLLTNGSKITVALLIAAHIAPGDDLSFPLPNSSTATAEILVTKNSLASSGRDVYQAPIAYLTQPKKDKRDEFFVAAEVRPANLGISSIFLPCKALREYFYKAMANNERKTGIRDYAITRIGTFCAVRSAEVFGLRWECDLGKDLFITQNTKTPSIGPIGAPWRSLARTL